ncbi:YfkD family protein [Amphibacillus jilinensis]|uniref:YfkD family protein n=1 Tax=Amphibacillus jilinensis TaxID=1216008 RepID=UPI0002EAE608|nr:YfkD family protein [Amphibacillus jilinensis]
MKFMLPILFFLCTFTPVTAATDFISTFSQNLPSHVQSVEEENTVEQKQETIKDIDVEGFVEKLLKKSEVEITNPHFIEQLNATDVNNSKFAFGYSSEVYLGRWPLHYQSKETSVNWAYQKINENFVSGTPLTYLQNEEAQISGGIQNKVANSDQVQSMVLTSVSERVEWPIAYKAVFGATTEKQIPLANEAGAERLEAYAAAVKESGIITYGEVYLSMTGRNQTLKIKNVVEEEVMTWLPIQHYLAFHLS